MLLCVFIYQCRNLLLHSALKFHNKKYSTKFSIFIFIFQMFRKEVPIMKNMLLLRRKVNNKFCLSRKLFFLLLVVYILRFHTECISQMHFLHILPVSNFLFLDFTVYDISARKTFCIICRKYFVGFYSVWKRKVVHLFYFLKAAFRKWIRFYILKMYFDLEHIYSICTLKIGNSEPFHKYTVESDWFHEMW